MAVTIGSNISAKIAERLLGSTGDSLGRTFERLSSGQRINHASDDAAGLAIADSLSVAQGLYTTALRNIDDGLSALTMIDSGLGQQASILQRMQELAEQAATGTYSAAQRASLQKEYTQLVAEFGRQGASLSFNGVNLLLGGRGANPSTLSLQAGITGHSSSVLSMSLGDSGVFSGRINLSDLQGAPDQDGFLNALDYDSFGAALEEGTVDSTYKLVHHLTAKDSQGRDVELVMVGADYSETGGAYEVAFSVAYQDPENGQWSIMDISGDYAFHVRFDGSTGRALPRAAPSGSSVDPYAHISFGVGGGAEVALDLDMRGLQLTTGGGISDLSDNIEFTSLLEISQARRALDVLARRAASLSQFSGASGAMMSRLENARNVLSAQKVATAGAESRIRDVDVAEETSRFVRLQIAQSAGAAILAQTGKQPALALQLLKNF